MTKFTWPDPSRPTAFPVARAGYPFIFCTAFATAVFALLGLTVLSLIGLVLALFIAFFFRDPDRLVGPARLAETYGKVKPENLARGIAATLFFDQEDDQEAAKLSQMRRQEGIEAILKRVCQIDPEELLGQMILKFAAQIQSH